MTQNNNPPWTEACARDLEMNEQDRAMSNELRQEPKGDETTSEAHKLLHRLQAQEEYLKDLRDASKEVWDD